MPKLIQISTEAARDNLIPTDVSKKGKTDLIKSTWLLLVKRHLKICF